LKDGKMYEKYANVITAICMEDKREKMLNICVITIIVTTLYFLCSSDEMNPKTSTLPET
jgi:hypothetical protein